jgi:hypothetical protein
VRELGTWFVELRDLNSDPLDANSWRRGRSRSLGQVGGPIAAPRSRSQSVALLYSSAVQPSAWPAGLQ